MVKKHLGACLGSVSSKDEFITCKVDGWIKHLENLSQFAKSDPHAAYAAFTYGFQLKWKYVQRTVPDIDKLFQPLEDYIRNKFIPALIGRAVSDTERTILCLPTRLGGLNIQNPVALCSKEYEWSQKLTGALTKKIVDQHLHISEEASGQSSTLRQIRRKRTSSSKICVSQSMTISMLNSAEVLIMRPKKERLFG